MNEDMIAGIRLMVDNQELFKQHVVLNAVLMRIAFESYQKAGFTEEQATEIIKARGPL
ncbi:hypothetical protein [Sporosarcina koreensis]|uniref:hypothetical protein n=1 Tax=Sporosarcina koreensis TaxID=334735 RepID=UPI000ACA8CBE|nr:hypothetical protein [Sporosarcina koreensis]